MFDEFRAIITLTLFPFALRPGWVAAQACVFPCRCPAQALPCPAGTSLLQDGCGCCKVCARQLGERCSVHRPCDHHRGLFCDFSRIQRDHGICLAHEGATCDLMGKTYFNGESFQPSCKMQCTCMDGAIGCVPLCTDGAPLPPTDCPLPFQAKVQSKCCEEWVCERGPRKSPTGKGPAEGKEVREAREAPASDALCVHGLHQRPVLPAQVLRPLLGRPMLHATRHQHRPSRLHVSGRGLVCPQDDGHPILFLPLRLPRRKRHLPGDLPTADDRRPRQAGEAVVVAGVRKRLQRAAHPGLHHHHQWLC
nr:PREDICTED: connective tissue growth factor isoform X2 [Anolis carolinensis]|eukprot:XP_016854293.1 PREDICTED: connective tissue growth factor isoform X2 [Anolis carolinensis]